MRDKDTEWLYYHILNLNDITYGESLFNDEKRWREYKQAALSWLNHTFICLTGKQVVEKFNSGEDLKIILEKNKERFFPGPVIEIDSGQSQQIYYDLWANADIGNYDTFFPFFFICKLSHVDILNIDHYLNSHLIENFESDKMKYFRFLELSIRRYKHLLNEDILQTVAEWKAIKENESTIIPEVGATEKTEKITGRIHREAGDNVTSLSLNQTTLLIQYLQKAKIIMKGDYLNYTTAGKAFNLLTGYSAHTLRQQLGLRGEIEGIKFDDYEKLHRILLELADLVEKDIRKK